MTTILAGNIRLAAGDDRSAILYNAYHLLTQMSALYGHFALSAPTPDKKTVVVGLADEVIQDLGDLYIAWEGLDKTNNQIVNGGTRLAKLIIRTSTRLSAIINLTNDWTPFVKTMSLALLIEKCWSRLLLNLCDGAGKEAAVLSGLQIRCTERISKIGQEIEKSKIANRLMQKSFDDAEQSLLAKSFGF